MKKVLTLLAVVMLSSVMFVGFGFAGKGGQKGPSCHADFDVNGLWSSGDNPDPNSWGKATFNCDGFDVDTSLNYVINIHNLTGGETYALYSGGDLVAVGSSNGGGNLHLQGSHDGSLGARLNIWLVTLDDDGNVDSKDYNVVSTPVL